MARNSKKKQEPAQVWERQPKESSPAYTAFCLYRNMPYRKKPEKRSLAKVGRKLGKSTTILERWSAEWNWQERCREYDNELQRIEFEERRAAIKAMQERHLTLALEVLQKAKASLEHLPDAEIEPRDLLNFIIRGIEIERRIRIEQMGAPLTTGASGGGKNAVTISEVTETEQSTMMQLVKSLENARKARKGKE